MRARANKRSASQAPYGLVTKRDKAALRREESAGLPPILVTENGLMTDQDSRYLLVAGERRPGSVLTGLILWDPASQDTVLAVPYKGKIRVRQGPAMLLVEMLSSRGRNHRIMAAAVESLGNAYDEDRPFVSHWLLELATEGLRGMLDHYGEDAVEIDYLKDYPRDQRTIWKDLKARGVDPWPGRGR